MAVKDQTEEEMTRNMAQTMPAGGAAGGPPVVPLGQTTVLSSEDLMRIKTTLLHADAKTMGTQLKSEVSVSFQWLQRPRRC